MLVPQAMTGFFLSALMTSSVLAGASDVQVSDLRCESRLDPIDMDVETPRLSWIDTSPRTGAKQRGFQIEAATSISSLRTKPNLWNTGLVSSAETSEILYAGKPLSSLEDVWWRVRTWDELGKRSSWSRPAQWSMGLLHRSDWTAHWIKPTDDAAPNPTVLVHGELTVGRGLKRARAFVCGLGQYELHVNGEKVGNDWLAPGWTQYKRTCVANEYDLTGHLSEGLNVVGVVLGNGMYNMKADARGGQQLNTVGPHKLIAQFVLEYKNGRKQVIGTDRTWQWAPGPETYSGVFGGEDYDARQLLRDWDGLYPGAEDLGHARIMLAHQDQGFPEPKQKPLELCEGPGGSLRGITHEVSPLQIVETRFPICRSTPKPGLLLLDLGQNAPYVPEIQVHGPAGSRLKMEPAEILHPDGTVDQDTMRAGKFASYTLDGFDGVPWHPWFWYVGCRYWQLSATDPQGKPIDPASLLVSFKGLMVHEAVEKAGSFECSNDLFNKTARLIDWAIRSNLGPVISDCPHREKSGWLEQLNLMGPELVSSYDLHATLSTMLDNMQDAQHPDGRVPTMAPEYFFYDGGFADSVEWGGSLMLVADLLHEWYGDREAISSHYLAMRGYVDYLRKQAPNGILLNGLGDWNGGGADPRTPPEITNTAYYYKLACVMWRFATMLGHSRDGAEYSQLASKIRSAFRSKYFDPKTGKVGQGSQSAQATAIDLGLLSGSEKTLAFQRLLDDVDAHDYSVSCGEVGHPALLHVLQAYGRSDVISRIHSQTDKPGYGYQIKKGLTTLAESWDASPISQNHFMLGQILEWFTSGLCGLQPDPAAPGFSHFFVRPQLVDNVSWAATSYKSPQGLIKVSWKKASAGFELRVTVPMNSSCAVTPPVQGKWTYADGNGKRTEGDATVIHLPSGSFTIRSSR